MSLTTATLLPGLILVVLGALFLVSNSAIQSMFKALPRSRSAAYIFFGAASIWFIYVVSQRSPADLVLFDNPRPWVLGFGVLAALTFFYVPDFLAVRGLCALVLLAVWPPLMAGYMVYNYPQLLVLKSFLYVCVVVALYLAAVPYRLRDFFQWLFSTRGRPRIVGGALLTLGLTLSVLAFTY